MFYLVHLELQSYTVHVTLYMKCTPSFLCPHNGNTQEFICTQSTTYEIILNNLNLYTYQALGTIAVQVPFLL
jgi:hypothetical protein